MALPFFHTMSSISHTGNDTLVLVERRVLDVTSEWTTEVTGRRRHQDTRF